MSTELNQDVVLEQSEGKDETIVAEEVKTKTISDIVKEILAKGGFRKNDRRVKNIKTEKYDEDDDAPDAPYRLTFVVNTPVPGVLKDAETDEYKEGVTNNVFLSSYALAGFIKENEDLAWLADTIISKPKLTAAIFVGSTIDVVGRIIEAGEEYVNPFSTREDAPTSVYDHPWCPYSVVKVKLSKNGLRIVDKIIERMIDEEI